MNWFPTKIEKPTEDRLVIEWSDGQVREYLIADLRQKCPCATCREKRRAGQAQPNVLPILSLTEAQPMRITAMRPVGHYAYAIHFADGHNTGIYTLESLRELGQQISPDPPSGLQYPSQEEG
jgi:DUF971 family protein